MASDTWVLIGDGSLLAGCGDVLLGLGQTIAAVVIERAGDRAVGGSTWHSRGVVLDQSARAACGRSDFDHLASIAHLSIVPADALRVVRGLAVNFHDGPLPELAGLNVTSWAILRGEKTHGVTWHVMTERADEGRILEQRRFDVAPATKRRSCSTRSATPLGSSRSATLRAAWRREMRAVASRT